MFPEAEVTVFGLVPTNDFDSALLEGLTGSSGIWSVGVGGVTVMGAWRGAFGGVWGGVVTMRGRSRLLEAGRSVAACKGCGTTGRSSEALEVLRKLMLFLLSPILNKPPSLPPLPVVFKEARSGLVGGLAAFSFDPGANTPLNLDPGEIPRPFLVSPKSGVLEDASTPAVSIVAACRGTRFVSMELALLDTGKVVDFE